MEKITGHAKVEVTNMKRLIDKLRDGVQRGEIQEPFTYHDFEKWMDNYNIAKDDGVFYSDNSKRSLLSNSAKQNAGSSNLNDKMLNSDKNDSGK
jgi:hypothetical protein